jgi:hypothetical protein
MSPFKGQGANQAMMDAISLASLLSEAAGLLREGFGPGGRLQEPTEAAAGELSPPSSSTSSVAAAELTCSSCGVGAHPRVLAKLTALQEEACRRRAAEEPTAQAAEGSAGDFLGPSSDAAPAFTCTECRRVAAIANGTAVQKARQGKKRGAVSSAEETAAKASVPGESQWIVVEQQENELVRAVQKELRRRRAAATAAASAQPSSYRPRSSSSTPLPPQVAHFFEDPLAACLSSFERRMIARGGEKVLSSRAAGGFLHSVGATNPANCRRTTAARAAAGTSLMGCALRKKAAYEGLTGEAGEEGEEAAFDVLSESEFAKARGLAYRLLRGEHIYPLSFLCRYFSHSE